MVTDRRHSVLTLGLSLSVLSVGIASGSASASDTFMEHLAEVFRFALLWLRDFFRLMYTLHFLLYPSFPGAFSKTGDSTLNLAWMGFGWTGLGSVSWLRPGSSDSGELGIPTIGCV